MVRGEVIALLFFEKPMKKLTFADLSFNADLTPVSTQFDDIYFSTQGGLAESRYVFQEGNQLWQRWLSHSFEHFVIAETGFGTGLNFLAVAELFREFQANYPEHKLQRLYFISFEKYPLTATQLAQIHQRYPQFSSLSQQLCDCWLPRQSGCERYHFGHIYLDLWFGDMLESLSELGDYHTQQIDSWFLDGFSPDKNPEMWNEELYRHMFRLTRQGGSFATFTASSAVRRGLQAVGFEVKKRKGFGKKREMLWGEKPLDSNIQVRRFPYFFQQNQTYFDDIAIVGGGVASLFLAWSLRERGKKVTLYCQDEAPAKNASGNLQGALYPQLSDDDERNVRFYMHSFDYAKQRLAHFFNYIEVEHAFSGVALCAYNDKTAQKLQKMVLQVADDSLICYLDSTELSEKVGLALHHSGAFIPNGGWLSPKQLVEGGFSYLEQQGLKVYFKHCVDKLEYMDGYWHWDCENNHFQHRIVILANGHQAGEFEQMQGIPLYPVRGQVSYVPSSAQLSALKCVLCYDGYFTPASSKQLHCIGASHIRDNQQTHFSFEEHQQNFAKLSQNMGACEWLNELDFSANQGKVGIRSALRDRMPLIGAVPNITRQTEQYANLYNQLRRKEVIESAECYPNLYTMTALGSRGFTTAPLLAEILASQICAEPMPICESIWQNLTTNRSWIRQWVKGRIKP